MSKPKMTEKEMLETADEIRHIEQDIHENLLDAKDTVNTLEQSWVSTQGEKIRLRICAGANRYENGRGMIQNYAEFLERTAPYCEKDKNGGSN